MKIFYCAICSKYKKFEKPKISSLLEKTLVSFYYFRLINSPYEVKYRWNEYHNNLKYQ